MVMKENVKIHYTITPSWQIIEDIRQKIKHDLSEKVPELIDFATICSSELCENALKYGSSVENMKEIRYNLELKDNFIFIEVSNGVNSPKDLKKIMKTIDLINRENDPETLYMNRLKELMENPKSGESQLGLFRIVYESGFRLSYKYKDAVLTIYAKRSIQDY
jgi:hypothetical protein